jgi:penicillin-binding protein 1A
VIEETPGRRPDLAEQILMEVLGLLGGNRRN